jgi:hypothetical protein
MFELISYDIHKQDKKYVIQIFIANTSEDFLDAKIVFTDSIFEQCTKKRDITFNPKTTHWIAWDLTQDLDTASNEVNGLQLRALWGANLKIYINEQIVNEFQLKYTFTNLSIRNGLNNFSPFNKKKFWILGDSHAGLYTNTSTQYLITTKYDIIPLGLLGLSLNRFLKSDWEKWYNTLPIFEGDIVALDIGEIDLRCGLFLSSIKKNIDLSILKNQLLENYFEFLIYFKQKFKKDLIIIQSNRPIKDGHLTGNAQYFKVDISTEYQRIELWDDFNNCLSSFCEKNSIKFWDIKHMYRDKNNTLFNDILYENDIHIKVKEPMLFDLKYKIENLL